MNEQTLPASVDLDGHSLSVIDHNGKAWMTLHQIGEALDYEHPRKVSDIYRRNRDEFTDEMTALIRRGRTRVRIFSPRGAHLVGMFARTEKAKAFRRFALDVLDRMGRQDPQQSLPAPAVPPPLPDDVRRAIERKAHAMSLRAFERNRETLEAWIRKHQGWDPKIALERIHALDLDQGQYVAINVQDLWGVINRVMAFSLLFESITEEVHRLEETTGRKWYARVGQT